MAKHKFIINEYTDESEYAIPDGMAAGYEGWDNGEVSYLKAAVETDFPIIPKEEWHERIKEKAAKGGGLRKLLDLYQVPVRSQGNLNYCWCYASMSAVEIRRIQQGLEYKKLSPVSVGGPITNWSNVSGWNNSSMAQLEKDGACEESFLDNEHSLNYKNWKAGWKENRRHYKVEEWYDTTDFDKVVTLLLNDIPVSVGYNHWRHAIVAVEAVIVDAKNIGILIRNSWMIGDKPWGDNGYAVMSGSKMYPDGGASPRTVTISNGE